MNILKKIVFFILVFTIGSFITSPMLLANEQKCEAQKELDLKNINLLYTSIKKSKNEPGYTPCE
ncbi:MAG: hypothetical protein H0X26_00645 [Alphaproteobacteria bacterium]|nr:hypothetical protein [Alphaproteobacteria bacterium]